MALVRKPPKGLLRLALRLPIVFYRCGLGWLLGPRMLMLTHIGRTSGQKRRTVLEIVRRDAAQGVFIICSGWGRKSQWFRNISANPGVWVSHGARTRQMYASVLAPADAEIELRNYARRYPRNLRLLSRLMLGREYSGSDDDFSALSRDLPVVALGTPETSAGGGARTQATMAAREPA